ncbi:unnamed protein product [marine sediment metagenome]|uniref:RCK N-terminal domain-containing protein n=1 Tax=marine sediment metagenome TaxID=412755 RepID=X1E5Z0_9ZZZZ
MIWQPIFVIKINGRKNPLQTLWILFFKRIISLVNGISYVLEEGGVKGSDFLAAVTNNDRVNIVASLLAKTYRVPRVVARISGPQQLDNPLLLKETGLYTVCPEKVVADKIAQLIEVPFASLSEVFVEGRVQMLKLEVKKGAGLEVSIDEAGEGSCQEKGDSSKKRHYYPS